MCVVHADRRVVIDGRFPEQCIIGVVSAMRTKQSIGYKMISHGSWSSPIERQRKKTNKKGQSGKCGIKKKGERTFRMTTVEIVLITSSQLIRLGKLYATKAEQMLLTTHKFEPTQKKMSQKADKLHLWWLPSCWECKQGCAHMLAVTKEKGMAACTMWGKHSPESAK